MTARSFRPWLAVVTLVLVLGAATGLALAAAGDLDTSFSDDGKQTTDFTTAGEDTATGVAVQSDGKIVAAGTDDTGVLSVARYNTDGSPDSSFSSDGKVVTPDVTDDGQVPGVAIQADGKIVVAGGDGNDFAVVRYTSTGDADPDFGGGDGIATTDFDGDIDRAVAVAIQPDGKIVAAGNATRSGGGTEFGVARYADNGDPDGNFDGDGEQMAAFPSSNFQNAFDMGLQEDGSIVVAGRANFDVTQIDAFGFARVTSTGQLDPAFDGEPGNLGGGDGLVAYDPSPDGYARGVEIAPGGERIVAAGSSGTDFGVMRLNTSDGSLDPSFSGDGIQTTDLGVGGGEHANGVTVQPDGKVVAAGEFDNQSGISFGLARYLTDGSLDPSFGGDGTASTDFSTPSDPAAASAQDVVIKGDGKAVAVGGVQFLGGVGDFALARYQADPGPPPPEPIVCCAPPPRRTLADLPDPVQGVTTNVEPVAGRVLIGIPAGLARASGAGRAHVSQKGVRFVPLTEARQIPIGSFLNTRRGTVRLQSARDRRGTRQQGNFSSGLFQVLQSRRRSARGLTDLVLKGSSFRSCRRPVRGKRAGAAQSRLVRRLRANARGRFRTRGRHSAATVRGTVWLTSDRCDGTLTRVTRGRVAVRDFRRKRTILLRAGKSYLARARP